MIQRKEIEDIITKNGGKYSGDLTQKCTHLVCKEAVGAKYEFAQNNAIPCVSTKWVSRCVSQKLLVPTTDFLMTNDLQERRLSTATSFVDPVENDDIFAVKPTKISSCLSGCQIYIGIGFSDEKTTRLKQLILNCGASRVTDYSSLVTHYLVQSKSAIAKDIEYIQKRSFRPLLVDYRWLKECYVAQLRVSEEMFLVAIPDENEDIQTDIQINANAANAISENAIVDEPESEDSGTHILIKKKTNTGKEKLDIFTKRNAFESMNNAIATAISKPCGGDNSLSTLFGGIKFCIQNFSPEKLKAYTDMVIAHGAESVCENSSSFTPSIMNNRIMIVPFAKFIPKTEVAVYTEIWLDKCIDNNNVQFEFDIYDRPLPFKQISAFEAFSFSITGYENIERSNIGKLAQRLGSAYSESFSRRNTHLICKNKEGVKFEKATEWKVVAVTADWLVECAKQGKILDISPYRLNGITDESSNAPPVELPINESAFEQISMTNDLPDETIDISRLLEDVKICLSLRLSHEREVLRNLAMEMGAEFMGDKFSAECTHYLHSSNKLSETFKEFKQARKLKKFIVSPEWLKDCKKYKTKLPETDYPHTLDGSRRLNVTRTKISLIPFMPTKDVGSPFPSSGQRREPAPHGPSPTPRLSQGILDIKLKSSPLSLKTSSGPSNNAGKENGKVPAFSNMLASLLNASKQGKPNVSPSRPATKRLRLIPTQKTSLSKFDEIAGTSSSAEVSNPIETRDEDEVIYDDPLDRSQKNQFLVTHSGDNEKSQITSTPKMSS